MGKRDVRKWVWTWLTIAVMGFAGGCSHRSLVGTWKVSGGALTRDNATATVDFHNDGTALLTADVSKPFRMRVQFDATYTLKGDVLKVDFKAAHIHAVDPAVDKKLASGRAEAERRTLASTQTGNRADKIAWVDDNQFISKESQGVVLYERISGK